jgi:hypothetical protein
VTTRQTARKRRARKPRRGQEGAAGRGCGCEGRSQANQRPKKGSAGRSSRPPAAAECRARAGRPGDVQDATARHRPPARSSFLKALIVPVSSSYGDRQWRRERAGRSSGLVPAQHLGLAGGLFVCGGRCRRSSPTAGSPSRFDEALCDAVALGLSHEGGRSFDPQTFVNGGQDRYRIRRRV